MLIKHHAQFDDVNFKIWVCMTGDVDADQIKVWLWLFFMSKNLCVLKGGINEHVRGLVCNRWDGDEWYLWACTERNN